MSSNLKVLVTGGRGFIGSMLVEDLLQRGFKVCCLLRKSARGLGWLEGSEVQVCEGDINEPTSVANAVAEVDYVFHLAGVTKARTQREFYQVNVEGTRKLLEAVRRHAPRLQRFVSVSSLAVSGPSADTKTKTEADRPQPVSHYGKSKLAAEELLLERASEIPISIVRPPAVFGPRDQDIFEIFKYAKLGWRLLVSGGPRYLSMIYVKDLVRGLLLVATDQAAAGQTYFLTNERPLDWEDFGRTVDQVIGKHSRRIIIPLPLVFLISCGGEIYGRITRKAPLINLDKYKEIKPTHWICSGEKAKRELGFETRWDLVQAVKETVSWYRQQGWL